MALRKIESWGHVTQATAGRKWTDTAIAGSAFDINGILDGPNGKLWLQSNVSYGFNQTFSAANDTWVVGFRFRSVALDTVSSAIVRFLEATTVHTDIRLGTDGRLVATRNGTVLGTSASALSAGTLYYIEVKTRVHDTLGTIVLRVNGVEWLSLSGVDTRNAGTAGTPNQVRFARSGLRAQIWAFGDIYICDGVDGTTEGQSAAFNDFLGDRKVVCLFPNAAGTYSQGTPSGAASILDAVKDATPDGDTSYVSLDASEKFTLGLEGLVANGAAVQAIQVCPCWRKDDASATVVRTLERLGSTDRAGDSVSVGDTYLYGPQLQTTKPGGGAWDIAAINDLEAGVERVS